MRMCGVGKESPWKWFHVDDQDGGPWCTIIPSALESGAKSIDNKVMEPDEVVVRGYVHEDDYAELKKIDDAIESKDFSKTMLTVVTRDATYTDMCPIRLKTHSVKDNWEYVEATLTLQQILKDDAGADGDDSLSR